MVGTSLASRTMVSTAIARPVRGGMSYMTTGRSVAAATARKWASMPAWGGRL